MVDTHMDQISETDALCISIALDLGLELSAAGLLASNGADITSAARAWASDKLSTMTIEEKVSLLSGEDQWRTAAIRRLGVSRLKTSDGPVGVRGGLFSDNATAASLPTG